MQGHERNVLWGRWFQKHLYTLSPDGKGLHLGLAQEPLPLVRAGMQRV